METAREEPPHHWDRLPKETPKSYAAFLAYVALLIQGGGDARNLGGLLGESHRIEWSSVG